MGKANTSNCSMDCFHCEFADCIQNGWMTTPFEKEQLRIRDEKKAAERAAQRERAAHQKAVDKQFAAWARKNLKRGHHEPTKPFIDKLLAATVLTYEEAFKK